MKSMPSIVGKFCFLASAWVVGSAANPEADLSQVKDWDLLVPFEHWSKAAGLIGSYNATRCKPNTFGGWKIITSASYGSVSLDVWPADLSEYLIQGQGEFIWHPSSGKRFRKQ